MLPARDGHRGKLPSVQHSFHAWNLKKTSQIAGKCETRRALPIVQRTKSHMIPAKEQLFLAAVPYGERIFPEKEVRTSVSPLLIGRKDQVVVTAILRLDPRHSHRLN